jgi:hypothetical protein
MFTSLFGSLETLATFDGTTIETVEFPEHTLDLDRIDGLLNEPGGPRRIQTICLDLLYQEAEALQLRVELKDPQDGVRFTRLAVASSPTPQQHCWDFRNPALYGVPPDRQDADIHYAKELTLIVERHNVAADVQNPDRGSFDLLRLWFSVNRSDRQPQDNQALLDLLARRTYQYFLD